MKVYDGRCLNLVTITTKIDGVKAIWDGDKWVSRAGKPLYNLPKRITKNHLEFEVFLGDFSKSISAVRTHVGKEVQPHHLYQLQPIIDARLVVASRTTINNEEVREYAANAYQQGYEGLVLYSYEGIFKVKRSFTEDIPIRGIREGRGKYKKKLGAFITDKGKIGTGFTDAQRKEYFNPQLIGSIIEVSCMELTASGKFRHPRFVRLREDLTAI